MADTLTHTLKNNMIQVGGTTDVANSPIIEQGQIVMGVTWTGTIAVGDKVSLEDGDGNTWCDFECVVANQPMKELFPGGYRVKDGIYSDDMDSGKLRIQIR